MRSEGQEDGGLLKYWWALILVAIAVFFVLRRSKP
jgi:hypothetical protein